MRRPVLFLALAALGLIFAAGAYDAIGREEATDQPILPTNPITLKSPADFAAIDDLSARSIALFQEAGKVIQSPRCMNCHPRTDRPTQTDAMRVVTGLASESIRSSVILDRVGALRQHRQFRVTPAV